MPRWWSEKFLGELWDQSNQQKSLKGYFCALRNVPER